MMKEYKTEKYNAIKAFVYLFVLFVITMLLVIYLSVKLNMPLLGVIYFICFTIFLFLFKKKILDLFTNRIILEFNEDAFIITETSLKEDNFIDKSTFIWKDIKSYKVYFTPSKLTYLTIYHRNGSSKTYGFKDNKTFQEAIKQESVFNLFYYYVKLFNNNNNANKIILAPPFLTSKLGTSVLFSIVGLSIMAACIHIFKAPKSSPFTLIMAFFMILILLGKRKQDKESYNKISNL
jgi:hypothetical protein